ncbi:PIN domain-containing protein [Luteolibacter sp. LG18]|uniref:PIN domain-containing protein n=1 Tax=Luteolibacter sp. LG18 TaxID=2819286 RepID=UPI002B2C55C1|nr:hypothetical protein llg_21060 [Luteolibacter sp. LG18]
MTYLLDTSALLAHYRQEAGWEAVHQLFENTDASLIIASVTVAEFARRMVELGASESEISTALQNYRLIFSEVVSIDDAIAWEAFEIGRKTPGRLPLADALIAAAASSRDATLVHRDKHMSQIPGKLVKTRDLAK